MVGHFRIFLSVAYVHTNLICPCTVSDAGFKKKIVMEEKSQFLIFLLLFVVFFTGLQTIFMFCRRADLRRWLRVHKIYSLSTAFFTFCVLENASNWLRERRSWVDQHAILLLNYICTQTPICVVTHSKTFNINKYKNTFNAIFDKRLRKLYIFVLYFNRVTVVKKTKRYHLRLSYHHCFVAYLPANKRRWNQSIWY